VGAVVAARHEVATEVIWARSPGFTNRTQRAMLASLGGANLAMTVAYAARARQQRVA
jgi:hypothetical protein